MFGVVDVPALKALLSIPGAVHVVAVVTVGHPAEERFPEAATSRFRNLRKPRDEVVHWERWNEAR